MDAPAGSSGATANDCGEAVDEEGTARGELLDRVERGMRDPVERADAGDVGVRGEVGDRGASGEVGVRGVRGGLDRSELRLSGGEGSTDNCDGEDTLRPGRVATKSAVVQFGVPSAPIEAGEDDDTLTGPSGIPSGLTGASTISTSSS